MIKWRIFAVIIDLMVATIGTVCIDTYPTITHMAFGYLFLRCTVMTMNAPLSKKPT